MSKVQSSELRRAAAAASGIGAGAEVMTTGDPVLRGVGGSVAAGVGAEARTGDPVLRGVGGSVAAGVWAGAEGPAS